MWGGRGVAHGSSALTGGQPRRTARSCWDAAPAGGALGVAQPAGPGLRWGRGGGRGHIEQNCGWLGLLPPLQVGALCGSHQLAGRGLCSPGHLEVQPAWAHESCTGNGRRAACLSARRRPRRWQGPAAVGPDTLAGICIQLRSAASLWGARACCGPDVQEVPSARVHRGGPASPGGLPTCSSTPVVCNGGVPATAGCRLAGARAMKRQSPAAGVLLAIGFSALPTPLHAMPRGGAPTRQADSFAARLYSPPSMLRRAVQGAGLLCNDSEGGRGARMCEEPPPCKCARVDAASPPPMRRLFALPQCSLERAAGFGCPFALSFRISIGLEQQCSVLLA